MISKEEVERMKKDAEMHAADDKKKQEVILVKNNADALIYTCEKTLRDAGDKVKAEDKKMVEDKITSLKEAQKGDNIDDIKAKTKELSDLIQKIGGELYKNEPKPNPEEKDMPKEEPQAEEGKYSEQK